MLSRSATQRKSLLYAKKFQGVITELDKEGLKDQASAIGEKSTVRSFREPDVDFIVDKNTSLRRRRDPRMSEMSAGSFRQDRSTRAVSRQVLRSTPG